MLIFLPMPVFKRVSRSRLWDTICAAVVAVPSSGLSVAPDVVVPSVAEEPVAAAFFFCISRLLSEVTSASPRLANRLAYVEVRCM